MTMLFITGPRGEREKFYEAERQLKVLGYQVTNPFEFLHVGTAYLLTKADGVAMLPGSEDAEVAAAEIQVAEALNLPVLPVSVWISQADMEARSEPRA